MTSYKVKQAEKELAAAKTQLSAARTEERTRARQKTASQTGVSEWLGETMRMLRKRAGMTQQNLADAVGVTRSAVALIETHRCNTTTKRLVAICDALKTDPNTLLGYE